MSQLTNHQALPTSGQLKMLVVDDIESNRLVLEAMLIKMGHRVTLADSGPKGLALFVETQPDMVLLDVSMPEMDGFEVAKAIRRSNTLVPIFFISASTLNEDVVKGLRAGGDDYLFKPLSYEILQSKIESMLERLSLAAVLSKQNHLLLNFRERIEDETHTARDFIKQFIALDKINDPLVKFMLQPAENFSGDLIAVARTPDHRLHVLLADSAGHGLTAALAVIPITQPFYQMTAKGFDIPAIIREINRRVHDYLPLPRFVAAIFLSLDTEMQTLQVWNGGCPSALLLNHDGTQILHRFESNHLPLGIVSSAEFNATPDFYRYSQPHGHVLLCSDGATEITVDDGRTLSHDGLLSGAENLSNEHLFDRLVGGIEHHLKTSQADDDIALILIELPDEVQEDSLESSDTALTLEVTKKNARCYQEASGKIAWEIALTLTADQLKRMDVVPFLLNITDQIEGGNATGKVFLVLSELFNNALDHGLLKLDSTLKNAPEGLENYFEERAKRLAELAQGQIALQLKKHVCKGCSCLTISIKDSGEGFDYTHDPISGVLHNHLRHGRGIALLCNICRDLRYAGNGSEVTACLDYMNA
ncbi:MAG: SpoIIE family protein phosphatase [Sideroxydans sp.]